MDNVRTEETTSTVGEEDKEDYQPAVEAETEAEWKMKRQVIVWEALAHWKTWVR
ncbi:unnamed protein product [marine sediment metagenome]|uniref:Uncharacterized protein n=1 Tax=marine sediment metagenome TaxID=412755 RepID=X1Q8H1_9ZZZZ